MHLHGQLPGMPLLKDGRGLDINGAAADPRLSLQDMCNQGKVRRTLVARAWDILHLLQKNY